MKLSAAEYEIMECVWALGRPVSGMDIMRALGQEKGWKQPTVLTFLSRLVEKGLLETEKRGKLRSYTAAMTREAYKNSETRDFLAQLYGGSIQNMVACMADGGGIRLKNWRPCARG
ncbi:MAG: BlaI/MecI/CopY family transcriptional regulator [Ruthenibacterium lactatiformans]